MYRFFYQILFFLCLPYALWKIGKRYRWRAIPWREYFGFCPLLASRDKKIVWIHSVSVGEAKAAQALVRELREMGCHLYLTCTTVEARHWLKKEHPDAVVAALPLDFSWAMHLFFNRCRPDIGIILEAEYWPNLLFVIRKKRIPLLLANARLSKKSARRWKMASSFFRDSLQAFSTILAQTPQDARRIRCYYKQYVSSVGNLKFDLPIQELEKRRLSEKRTLLIASTREGEEALLLSAMNSDDFRQNYFTIIAPRHPARCERIERLLDSYGFSYAVRSRGEAINEKTNFYIADTIGEMNVWYSACDLAIIGGSFVDYGGQNPIEAMHAGCVVVIGPYVANYARFVQRSKQQGALLQVENAKEAMTCFNHMNEEKRQHIIARANDICRQETGALARHLYFIKKLLKNK